MPAQDDRKNSKTFELGNLPVPIFAQIIAGLGVVEDFQEKTERGAKTQFKNDVENWQRRSSVNVLPEQIQSLQNFGNALLETFN